MGYLWSDNIFENYSLNISCGTFRQIEQEMQNRNEKLVNNCGQAAYEAQKCA